MTYITGNLFTLIISIAAWAFVLYWTYKVGWLIRVTYKSILNRYLHSVVSGILAGLWLWIIFYIHFRVL